MKVRIISPMWDDRIIEKYPALKLKLKKKETKGYSTKYYMNIRKLEDLKFISDAAGEKDLVVSFKDKQIYIYDDYLE